MATNTVLDVARDADSVHTPSFIYLALYNYLSDDPSQDDEADTTVVEWGPDQLSWRLIPSLSSTVPEGGHESFGIHVGGESIVASDNQHLEDPMEHIRAFIRFPVRESKSHEDVVDQMQNLSGTFIGDAIDDGWQEWEWVYNVFETLEILDYLDDNVTEHWQYTNKPKMEVFKEKILHLAQQIYDQESSLKARVVDFPLAS